MINAAQIQDNLVINVISIDAGNMEVFTKNGIELVNTSPYGLAIGDYRDDGVWYRDIEGTKTKLPIRQSEEYEEYYTAMQQEIEGGAQ